MILLTSDILDAIPKNRYYHLSMDINEDPYYGMTSEINEGFVIGGREKKSTNTFYQPTSIYLTFNDIKITLAVLPVRKGVKLSEYVALLLDIVNRFDIQFDVLLMDRGYYSVEVIRYLKEQQIPFIMPVKKKRKEYTGNTESKGIWQVQIHHEK